MTLLKKDFKVRVSAAASMHGITGEAPRLISCQERSLGHLVPPQARLLLACPALDLTFLIPGPCPLPCASPCVSQPSAQQSDATDDEFEAKVEGRARVAMQKPHTPQSLMLKCCVQLCNAPVLHQEPFLTA